MITTWTDLKTLFASNKLKFLLALLPFLLIAGLKLAAYLVKLSANKAVSDAQEKDKQLSQEIKQANDAADQHVEAAKEAAQNLPPVDADWNKKK